MEAFVVSTGLTFYFYVLSSGVSSTFLKRDGDDNNEIPKIGSHWLEAPSVPTKDLCP